MNNSSIFAEKCLAVKKSLLEEESFLKDFPKKNGLNCGLKNLNKNETKNFINFVEKNKVFKERFGLSRVEEDSFWQQIICYLVIVNEDKFFVYQRKIEDPKYPEKRLEGKISVGIGGHINPGDTLMGSLYRELQEELVITLNSKELKDVITSNNSISNYLNIKPVALIKDDTNDVGKVHLGLVCIVEPKEMNIEFNIRKNFEIIFGKFMDMEEYKKLIEKQGFVAESWTEIVINQYLSK